MLGFSEAPKGRLVQQILDMNSRMGLAYERAVSFAKDWHKHARHMLVCPRGPTVLKVGCRKSENVVTIDRRHVLWVPAGMVHDDQADSVIYDTMALLPDAHFVDELIDEQNLNSEQIARLEQCMLKVQRNQWLESVIERYFYERLLNPGIPGRCADYLEKQVFHEFCRLALYEDPSYLKVDQGKAGKGNGGQSKVEQAQQDQTSLRALEYMEAHLFEPLDLKKVAKHARTSISTLSRRFKADFSSTPMQYLKNRRLDEAMDLLKRGEYNVADVCLIVGYEDVTSFSKAFKAKFGHQPSSVQPLASATSLSAQRENSQLSS